MTISNTARKAGPFPGNGVTTAFAFAFKVFQASDLLVVLTDASGNDATQTLSSQYTVALNANQDANPGGTVTMLTPPDSTHTLTIGSQIPYTQPMVLTNTGGFYPTVLNDAADREVALIQQLLEAQNRTLKVSISTPAGVSTSLPSPASNKVISWNNAGTALENRDITDFATAVAFTNWQVDTFTGDGVTTLFTLTANPVAIGNTDASIAGVTQVPNIDYTLLGTALTFTTAPPNGVRVLVRYGRAGMQSVNAMATEYYTATAGQTLFNLSTAYVMGAGALAVYLNGARLTPGEDYTETSTTALTLTTGATLGDRLLVVIGNVVNNATIGASAVGYMPTGAGAVARDVQSKLREVVSVKDFGAAGDGATDDAAAINAAITAVSALGGGRVILGAGTHIVGAALELPDNVVLRGAGQYTTVIKLKNSANVNIIQKKSGAVGFGAGLLDLTIDGNDANNTNGGVYWAGASTGRGPSFTFERVTVKNCRPVASAPSGEYAAILTTGGVWGVARDLDVNQNQYAVGWWHKGSDWQIDKLYLGPNGASYGGTGTHSMIIQGGSGNLFTSPYFGGNGGLSQVFLWGSSRNLFINAINDNSWENGFYLAALLGAGSNDNVFVGGTMSHSGGKANNTYSSVKIEDSTGNSFCGMTWNGSGHTSSGNRAKYAIEEIGTAGSSAVSGGAITSAYLTNFDGRRAAGGSYITAVFGFDKSDVGTLISRTKVDVQGPYDGAAPSTSSVPKLRLNNGGSISMWAGAYAYSYTWLQGIQDDGSNNLKMLVLNPMGGNVQVGLGTTGSTVAIANGTANGAVATTLGSVGPTGSTAGNPQGWLRINVAGTDRFIPYW